MSSLSAWVVDIFIGLLVAGIVSGMLVPVLGSAANPPLVLGVALTCVIGVLLVARYVRRRGQRR